MSLVKVVVLTNLTTRNSLPVIKALWKSPNFDLQHVVFFNNASQAQGQLTQVIRQFGLRKTFGKALGVSIRKTRLVLMKHFGWQIGGEPQFSHEFVVVHEIPHTIVTNLNSTASIQHLAAFQSDYFVTSNLSQIISPDVFSLPTRRTINIHLSLLPKCRGPLPVFWALYHDEEVTGVSFHEVAAGIDDGNILARFPVTITASADEDSLTTCLAAEAGSQVVNVLRDDVAGRLQLEPQDSSQASYQSFPTAEQRRQLVMRKSS